MNQVVSCLCGLFMGFTLGAGGTAIGNAMWGKFDKSGIKMNIGYWTFCVDAAGQDECQNTYNEDRFTDHGEYYRHFIED